MKTVLLKFKRELNKDDTLAAISCFVLSISIYFITKIIAYNSGF
ncbi:hypothetical protein [Maribacter sp. 2307UL18-2]